MGAAADPEGPARVVVVEERQNWGKKIEFTLAGIGYSVGLGNVWRFPYLCFRSGGGAFLIPFFIMLIICGVPMLYMELAVGQYTRQGPFGALEKMCPFFKGAGMATVVISFLFTTYYNVIISWAFYYLFSCFQAELPWKSCNHTWNTEVCWDNADKINATRPNYTRTPTEDFYVRKVLQQTSGFEEQGTLKWDLVLILLLCWIIVYFCIWKGPKSTGKVVYFTATFPYIVLVILLVWGLTLPGSLNGVLYFITPKWNLLLEANVWINAAAQNFNSLGVAFGGIITMSSYNKFNNNIFRDVLSIAVVDVITCLLAGFAIFSILGNLAHEQNMSVEDVVTEGPGLVYVVYPEAFTTMPVSQLFAFLFFFMLICLGIDSQFASVEVIVTSLQDHFAPQIKKYLGKKEVLVMVVCFVSFLCGLPNVTQGGIYFFQLLDYYAAGVSLMYLAFFEVVAISWFYGAKRLSRNIKEMTAKYPQLFFIVCWYILSPFLILGIWIFSLIQYAPLKVGTYKYPGWAIGVGWCLAMLSIMCIPIGMIHAVYRAKGNHLWQKFKTSLKSKLEEETSPPLCLNDEKPPKSNCTDHSSLHYDSDEQWINKDDFNTHI